MAGKRRALEVRLTPTARTDLLAVWQWNASEYGERRADAYVKFLTDELEGLSTAPMSGIAVPEYPGLRRKLVQRRSRRHGHFVFYRVGERDIQVIHVFHTSQDWRTRLSE